ncbi:MAG TPA: TatD family hydrolase [Candidatus Saccharimonadales bacterium]|nr:TatD family hydrolase [Candidatus Saccharimonadales bacterium]
MELVDTHCHLQFEKYRDRENEILASASKAGVKKLICVGTTLEDSKNAVSLAKQKKVIWASVGIHPHEAASFLADRSSSKKLKQAAMEPRVVAIGETGLDYYRQISSREDQMSALRAHIELGIELSLPVIFHVRDAWDDFYQIFDSYKDVRGVIHSFSSDINNLEKILERKLYVGLNGIMTFTKDQTQLEAAKAVPLDKLLLETDAPFLTPAPFRSTLCEPKHILTTAQFLANLRNESLEVLASATTANASELFKLST